MKMTMTKFAKSIKDILSGQVNRDGKDVPFYIGPFKGKKLGMYISSYGESETGHKNSIEISFNLSYFSNDCNEDELKNISSQIDKALFPTGKPVIYYFDDIKITIKQRYYINIYKTDCEISYNTIVEKLNN